MLSMTLTTSLLVVRDRGNSIPGMSWRMELIRIYRSKITFIAWSPDDAGIQVCALGSSMDLADSRSLKWCTPPRKMLLSAR